ncbi:LacI family DNA-binding transcriptional regulator [Sinorhizobium meliloti]|nr:LacI family DNA-binding transcriptional regulator [Sinorhizobium meliloti]MDW9603423.1 LacI family DNA-binding transcriptional regulator [Sinorhizobium meliloti]MDW9671560.1 LacI family DNA-binding transcriptional regulator [Sinorhizobium meliloti]MDW9950172.1 LacI family DNA-binding transcriptional regulator [Sinorhizobium meliloti]MDX0384970.1 LacI family DNA-binding transcriptional regulator [Sinorhizobium meliloti]
MNSQRSKGHRVTIHDLARVAGVSVSTVSKALNDNGRMAADTRERIKNLAAEIGFRPNALARGLLSNRSFTVGLLTNDTYGRFTLPVMAGVSEALVDHGVSVFLCAIEDDPALGKIHVDAMLDKQVDGIIATGKRVDRSLPVDLAGLPVPVVYAFTKGEPGSVTLTSDDGHGARLAAERLKKMGRKRLLHITGPLEFTSAVERAEAFRAVAGGGAPVLHGVWSEAWGHEAIDRIWNTGGERPDGIFCGNDQIARGVVDALRERGVRVPEDVSVIGFDNWEIMAAQTRPPLTTVDMNLKELGREAGLMVLALAEGRTIEPGLRKLPCRLVVRDSCGGGGRQN